MMRLADEIKQRKPFESLEQEAHLGLMRTAAVVGHSMAEMCKEHDTTPTQFNVLRILRGAGPEGLCRNEVRDRLVARVPDVTRLLDRMEEAGLVERARDAQDRRYVMTRIAPAGLRLLERIDGPMAELHRRQLGHLDAERLRTLIEILGEIRDRL